MQVLTYFDPSDPFTAQNGIGQGDAISPLLWRIFYDPLLEAICKDHFSLSEDMINTRWSSNVSDSIT